MPKTAAELAHERALAAEKAEVRRSEELLPHLDRFEQSALRYINRQLARGVREDEDVRLLKGRRKELIRTAERSVSRRASHAV